MISSGSARITRGRGSIRSLVVIDNDENSARTHYRSTSVTNDDNLARLPVRSTVHRSETVARTNAFAFGNGPRNMPSVNYNDSGRPSLEKTFGLDQPDGVKFISREFILVDTPRLFPLPLRLELIAPSSLTISWIFFFCKNKFAISCCGKSWNFISYSMRIWYFDKRIRIDISIIFLSTG